MNILLISNDPGLANSASSVRARMQSYAEEVAKTGGTLHILSHGAHGSEYSEGSLVVHIIRSPKLLSPWKLARRGNELIREHTIDVVSAQDPFEHGLAASWAIRGTKAKLHLQVHTDYLSPWFTRDAIFRSPRAHMPVMLNRIRIAVANRVVLRASGIRVVSQRIQKSMIERYGKAIPVPSVIPIKVSTEVPAKVEIPPRSFTFTLIAVGRLEPEKRFKDCIAAVKRLEKGYPSLGLVIVGDGRERRRLERFARKQGLANKIVFLGWRTDARGLMQDAQAFIQSSAYEGYGQTLIEAALAGVPIITSDVGIVGEVFTGYENVFSVPVGDPTNLASLTARLIEDHMARRTLSIEGKAAAFRHLAEVHNAPADIIADIVNIASK